MKITTSDLGWILLGLLIAGDVLASAQEWLAGRYELTRRGWRPRLTRRWYGTRAHVCLRADEDNDDAERYLVLGWDQEDTRIPWIRVLNIDDEDAWPSWAPVTDFAPYTVRRIRPHFERFGPVPVPWLTRYLPLRQPAGYPGDGA